ncbi:HET-domain-containing protein [Colletotrichum caudatum]|nr:HET-domain-containing protein [Colletotrichum caudatum]
MPEPPSMIVGNILPHTLLATPLGLAHPHGSGERQFQHSAQPWYRRSLDRCAEAFSAPGFVKRAIERRTDELQRLRKPRGRQRHVSETPTTSKFPIIHGRDFNAALDKDHRVNKDYNEHAPAPELPKGPPYVKGEEVRGGLTEGESGVKMAIDTQVVDVRTCQPITDAAVDFWSANSTAPLLHPLPGGAGSPDEDELGRAARRSSPLRCAVSTTPVATPRPYKALSYVWGPQDKSHSIDIGGARLGITASLDTALRHLRQDDEPVTLWVDQICINQADAAEKSRQVPLMAQIYSGAELVLVWLGPAADGSDALMECLEDVGQEARDAGLEGYLNRERLPLLYPMLGNRDARDPEAARFQALQERAVPAFDAVMEAMVAWNARPWFGRVWTIQEQALCPDTFFLCGSRMLNLDLLPLATLIIDEGVKEHYAANPEDPVHLDVRVKASDRRFNSLMTIRRRRRNFVRGEGPGDDLYKVLKKAYVDGEAEATLPRARIYGLLSVAVDAERLRIVPDYASRDCRPAFVEAARALVGAGRVETLSFSQPPKDVDGLPSWVPDWRPTLARSYMAVFEDQDGLSIGAAGDSTVEVVHTDDPCVLGIRGLAVDVIEETGGVWTWEAGKAARVDHLRAVKALCDESSARSGGGRRDDIYESSERRAEAAWRVPVGDMYWTAGGGYNRAARADGDDYEACLATHSLVVAGGFQSVPPELRQQRQDEFGRMLPGAGSYSNNMDIMTGKRPYVTRLGYVGMAPGGARPGDVVVVLLGSRIPYVLRPSGDGTVGFCFVGEAYCDGVMDGEMLTKRPQETFFIA